MSGSHRTLCLATEDARCVFAPRVFHRRALLDHDVAFDVKFCGVCHTDLHIAAGHTSILGNKLYPCVPGHEVVGVCTAVGPSVTRVRVGDHVGVGCMVDSCQKCSACKRGEEQFCVSQVSTYNGKDKSGRAASGPGGPTHTLGGYR